MPLLSLFIIYVVFSSCLIGAGVFGAGLPPQTCAQYFQYVSQDEQFVDRITLSNLPNGRLGTVLRLSYHDVPEGNFGDMDLRTDMRTAQMTLEHNGTLEYVVIFASDDELPKVTHLSVNSIELCSADDYPAPSVPIFYTHCIAPLNDSSCEDYKPPSYLTYEATSHNYQILIKKN